MKDFIIAVFSVLLYFIFFSLFAKLYIDFQPHLQNAKDMSQIEAFIHLVILTCVPCLPFVLCVKLRDVIIRRKNARL